MLHTDFAAHQVRSRQRELRAEAERTRRLAPARSVRPTPAAGFGRAIVGLGARRTTPSTTTTASATT